MQNKPISVDKRSGKLRWLKVGYFILIHLIVILAIISPPSIERVKHVFSNTPTAYSSYKGQVIAHVIQDASMPKGCIVFIGDSITSKLDLRTVVDTFTVNYSISSDSTVGALWRIPQYQNLNSAGAIVLAIGVNDLTYINDDNLISNYGEILDLLPHSVPVIISGILPLNEDIVKQSNLTYVTGYKATNARIKVVNNRIRDLCKRYTDVSFIDATETLIDEKGNLRKENTLDGIHLNPLGYKVWAAFLRSQLSRILEHKQESSNEMNIGTD